MTKIIIKKMKNVFSQIEKPELDDCYICLDAIGNEMCNGAILPYKCRHPICFGCLVELDRRYRSFDRFIKMSSCGVCRAEPNRYIMENKDLCLVSYSEKQCIYVTWSSINENTLFRDHIQHMLAHGY